MNSIRHNAKIPCTLAILTFNSGETLQACLESAKDFQEIIVCDGGSTDGTLILAQEYGCKIISQSKEYKYDNNKISDFSGVRNQTYSAASFDWYFYVDSDEYLSKEVVSEIATIIQSDAPHKPKVYKTPRKFTINGKIIDCAAVYPNYHIRFFHRAYVEGFRKAVHEKPVFRDSVHVGVLQNVTYVPTDIDDKLIRGKQNYYLEIEKKRHENFEKSLIFLSLKNTMRSFVVRLIKILWSHLFCRGTHMPLKKDLHALRYNMQLSVILIKILLSRHKSHEVS